MARVTVEDCVEIVSNRFELVLLAGQRARMISSGAQLTLERDRDKNPVVALREIAEQTVDPNTLSEDLVKGLQRFVETDESEEENLAIAAAEAETEGLTEEELLSAMKSETEQRAAQPRVELEGEEE